MALTAREQRVMDLFDCGYNAAQIAAELCLRRRSIEQIVAKYHAGNRDRLAANDMATGSADLLGAMIASGQTMRRREAAA